MVEETKEEEEEEGLECATNTPLGGSYMTPLSTGGRSSSSLASSHSPTPGDSDPENNAALHTEELEVCIEVFLEEAEEDLEMNDLPPLENTSPLLVPAPVFPGFVPFAVSTGQCCVLPKNLLRKVLSGPLCHLVCSLQTECYSAEDTLYQLLTPWWKQYPSTRAYTRTGL